MSGVSIATVVPCTSQTAVAIVSAIAVAPRGCVEPLAGTFRLGASTTSYRGSGVARGGGAHSSASDVAIDRSDGWSKSSVWDSSVLSRSPIDVESSVAPIESRPADISGASAAIAVPANSQTFFVSSQIRLSCEQVRYI